MRPLVGGQRIVAHGTALYQVEVGISHQQGLEIILYNRLFTLDDIFRTGSRKDLLDDGASARSRERFGAHLKEYPTRFFDILQLAP